MAQEQLQMREPVAAPRAARFAVAAFFFLTGMTFASWAARIPAIQIRLGLSAGELGVALLGTAAGELVSMNLAGYLVARFGILLALAVARLLLPAHADAQGAGVAFARPTRTLLALGFVAFCVVLGEGAMADWSAVYLHTILGAAMGLAATGYAAFSIVMAIGRGLGIA
jgi:hypothetical protein